MELEEYRRLKAFRRACPEIGCEHTYEYNSVPELIDTVHEHNQRAHGDRRWPNILQLSEYDKRFLKKQNISID